MRRNWLAALLGLAVVLALVGCRRGGGEQIQPDSVREAVFLMIKKYPTEERTYTLQKIETPVTITAYKRPDIKSISRRYTEYFNEIKDWVNEDVKNSGTANFEDLLYILNPEENVIQKDLAVIKRMSYYGFNLKHFNVMSTKININPDEQTNE